jgi:NADPH-dependent 7-cyano-7-deazaguanine reductase QueF-like protein
MITKQEVADFINATDINKIWTAYEIAYLQGKLDPFLATMMIKLVGDVSWLVEVRDNTAREYTNNDDLS